MLFKFPSHSKLQCSAQADPRLSLEGQNCPGGMRPPCRSAEAQSITEQGESREGAGLWDSCQDAEVGHTSLTRAGWANLAASWGKLGINPPLLRTAEPVQQPALSAPVVPVPCHPRGGPAPFWGCAGGRAEPLAPRPRPPGTPAGRSSAGR